MNISPSTFFSLLSGIKQYQIPIYQRNYAWEKEHCKRLLDDIVKAGTPGNPNHYIGSVIVKGESDAGGVNIFNVIDGQQRMTTISLLLLALSDYWGKNPSSTVTPTTAAILGSMKDIYLINGALSNTSLYSKILPKAGSDRNEYDNLLHGVVGNGAISSNYTYLMQELNSHNYNPETIFRGVNHAQLALVKLESPENPQLLFEAVNDTGVGLTNVDLVRNWLFMGLSGSEQDRLYRAYWEPIESATQNDIDSFLFYFTELKAAAIYSRDYYKPFKKAFILHAGSTASIESLLQEICKYADLYAKYKALSFTDKDINRALSNVSRTGKSVFTPLVLNILYQWDRSVLSSTDAALMLRYLESYIVRRDILSIPTNSLGSAMVSLLNHSSSIADFTNRISTLPERQRMPDDSEMRTQLQLRDFYHLAGAYDYLERIEQYFNPAFSLPDPTIEHILPETMHTNTFPKTGVSQANVNDYNWEIDLGPDAQLIHDKYQHTLGNLTILPRAENARMGDYRFDIKKNWSNASAGGFNYGYRYTPIRISQSLGGINKWDEKAILDRCEEMVSHLCKVWPHP